MSDIASVLTCTAGLAGVTFLPRPVGFSTATGGGSASVCSSSSASGVASGFPVFSALCSLRTEKYDGVDLKIAIVDELLTAPAISIAANGKRLPMLLAFATVSGDRSPFTKALMTSAATGIVHRSAMNISPYIDLF